MKKPFVLLVISALLTACAQSEKLVGSAKELQGMNAAKAELALNGAVGHLSILYNPSTVLQTIDENIKVLKNEANFIEIQRPNGEHLTFTGESHMYVCYECGIAHQNQFPVMWFKK